MTIRQQFQIGSNCVMLFSYTIHSLVSLNVNTRIHNYVNKKGKTETENFR